MENSINPNYWNNRRKLVFSTLVFCYSITLILMFNGDHDSMLHKSIMDGIMAMLMATIVGYIGAAVYDDVNSEIPQDVQFDYWKNRRRVVLSNLLFTAVSTVYLLFEGVPDSKLHSAIVTNLMLASLVALVSYIGGSTVQDKYLKKIK